MNLAAPTLIEAAEALAGVSKADFDGLTLCIRDFGKGTEGFDEAAVVPTAAVGMVGDLLEDVVSPGSGCRTGGVAGPTEVAVSWVRVLVRRGGLKDVVPRRGDDLAKAVRKVKEVRRETLINALDPLLENFVKADGRVGLHEGRSGIDAKDGLIGAVEDREVDAVFLPLEEDGP